MSVYKRGNGYYYDFRIGGHRFSGTIDAPSKREAQRLESVKKSEAREELRRNKELRSGPMTFKVAASRYFLEIGQHLAGDGADNLLWSLAWLEDHIGASKAIRDIDGKLVADLVSRRRGESVRNAKRKVSAATVNRSVTEPLRKILRRASEVWGEPVQRIVWRDHMLKEPKERVRELRRDEEERLFDNLRPDYCPIVAFAILTGCRLSECVTLRWQDVDFGGRKITIRGKGGKIAPIPMPSAVRELLWAERGHHETAVFTYVAERTRGSNIRGRRYPITRNGLKTTFRRTIGNAEIVDYRFHDNRHTAATRVLRASGNIKIVKELLRHDDISTTSKYAHVMHEDILNAMESAATKNATKNATAAPSTNTNDLKNKAFGK